MRVKRFPNDWIPGTWVEEFIDYKPFGELKNYVQSKPRFMFSSEEYMPETGMYHYLYRAYSPSLARFITRDPIEEQGGVNLYCFVGNNPISYWDRNGLSKLLLNLTLKCINGLIQPVHADFTYMDTSIPFMADTPIEIPGEVFMVENEFFLNSDGEVITTGMLINLAKEGYSSRKQWLEAIEQKIKNVNLAPGYKHSENLYRETHPEMPELVIKAKWAQMQERNHELLSSLADFYKSELLGSFLGLYKFKYLTLGDTYSLAGYTKDGYHFASQSTGNAPNLAAIECCTEMDIIDSLELDENIDLFSITILGEDTVYARIILWSSWL